MRRPFFIPSILSLAFSVLLAGTGKPQSVEFTRPATQDGLSSSIVNVIRRDTAGFVWIGTYDGLNRFDGSSVTVYRYRSKDPVSLSSPSPALFFSPIRNASGRPAPAAAACLPCVTVLSPRRIRSAGPAPASQDPAPRPPFSRRFRPGPPIKATSRKDLTVVEKSPNIKYSAPLDPLSAYGGMS
jgi:hypothetical protein